MAKTLYINSDKLQCRMILDKILKNDGYCPCQIKSENTKCPFSYYNLPTSITTNLLCINGNKDGGCYCGLYKDVM